MYFVYVSFSICAVDFTSAMLIWDKDVEYVYPSTVIGGCMV